MSGGIITAGPSQKPELMGQGTRRAGLLHKAVTADRSKLGKNSDLPEQDNVVQYLTRTGVVTVRVW